MDNNLRILKKKFVVSETSIELWVLKLNRKVLIQNVLMSMNMMEHVRLVLVQKCKKLFRKVKLLKIIILYQQTKNFF
jgi:hypothetical protein